MSRAGLDVRDHEMHRARNRALQRVLRSILIAERARMVVARSNAHIRSSGRSAWDRARPESPDVPAARRRSLRLVHKRS